MNEELTAKMDILTIYQDRILAIKIKSPCTGKISRLETLKVKALRENVKLTGAVYRETMGGTPVWTSLPTDITAKSDLESDASPVTVMMDESLWIAIRASNGDIDINQVENDFSTNGVRECNVMNNFPELAAIENENSCPTVNPPFELPILIHIKCPE